MFGQAIRAKLEALIPRGFAHWAEAARRWRSEVKASGLSFNARRRFWQIFTAHAVGNPNHEPEAADYDRLLTAAQADSESADKGSVTLVGAGPGDPELLTLRAVRALQSADVILFDDLVSPEILEFARREAKKMLVGKTGHGPSCKQDEINALMVGLAKPGRRVVRLKGGDPMIFGRAGEEIAACRKADVAIEIVPGITAAQGAASRLGVSLTSARRRGGCNMSPATAPTARCRTTSTGEASPIRRRRASSTCRRKRWANWRRAPSPRGSIRRRQHRCRARDPAGRSADRFDHRGIAGASGRGRAYWTGRGDDARAI